MLGLSEICKGLYSFLTKGTSQAKKSTEKNLADYKVVGTNETSANRVFYFYFYFLAEC